MGKKKRVKEQKSKLPKIPENKMFEGKKLDFKPVSGFFLKRNIEALDARGEKDIILGLSSIKERPIATTSINLKGVKNPLVSVFIGLSTKALIDALRRKKKTIKSIIVVEPNADVFKNLIMTEDIADLIADPTVDFIIGRDGKDLIPALFKTLSAPIPGAWTSKSTMIQNMEIIVDPFQYHTEEQVAIANQRAAMVREAIQQLKLSMGCSDDQSRRFELMILNKKNMYKSWKINNLYDKFKDVPAIVCGGGPSLEGFIKAYKESDSVKNSIIIAADAVLKKLLDEGIKPHIVVRCERKKTNIFQGITKEMTKGIYYAAYPWTPVDFFDLFEDSFYLFRQNGVCMFTELSHASVDGGVSSGNAAMELAINLGCRDIFLTGIDLVLGENGETHVSGTMVEFDPENSKAQWEPTPTNDGKTATTIPVWKRCLNEYMQSVDKHRCKGKEINVYNTSEKGAFIPLTTYKPWTDVSLFFNMEKNKEIDLDAMFKKYRSKLSQKEIDKFEARLKDSIASLKIYAENLAIAEELAMDAKRTADGEIAKIVDVIETTIDNPYDRIKAYRQNIPNLLKLWTKVAEAIDDHFKKKCYPEFYFRILIFDILQLDLYHYENAVFSTVNNLDEQDERCEAYFKLSREFMRKCKIYCEKLVDVFETSVFETLKEDMLNHMLNQDEAIDEDTIYSCVNGEKSLKERALNTLTVCGQIVKSKQEDETYLYFHKENIDIFSKSVNED